MRDVLTPVKALIFRITHINNIPWILANGVHCRESPSVDPNFINIGCPDLIEKRKRRVVPVPPGGTLSAYVPFYFTPLSPMLLNIKTGRNGVALRPMSEIVILVSSLHRVRELSLEYLFTNQHAYTTAPEYFSDLSHLSRLDWEILQTRDFKRDLNDPAKIERYMAEALIHHHVPVSAILGMVCHGPEQLEWLRGKQEESGVSLKTVVKPDWYF